MCHSWIFGRVKIFRLQTHRTKSLSAPESSHSPSFLFGSPCFALLLVCSYVLLHLHTSPHITGQPSARIWKAAERFGLGGQPVFSNWAETSWHIATGISDYEVIATKHSFEEINHIAFCQTIRRFYLYFPYFNNKVERSVHFKTIIKVTASRDKFWY